MSFLGRHWFAPLLLHIFLLQSLAISVRLAMIYRAVALDLGTFWVGIIGGIFGLLPALFALNIGRHIDRAGEKSALVWGPVINLAASIGLALVEPTLPTLIAASVLMGSGQFLAVAGQQSAASQSAPANRAQNFGWMTLTIALAQTTGPLVVGYFAIGEATPDTHAIFVLASWGSVATFVCALLIRMPERRAAHPTQGMLQDAMQILGTEGFMLATTVSLLVFSAMELLIIYLPVYGAERAINAATVSFLLAVRGGASILSRLFFGPALSIFGRKSFLVASLLIAGLSIGGMVVTANIFALGAMLFAAGLGMGVSAPLTLAWLAEIVPAGLRGSGYSMRLSLNRIAQFILPVAAGPLAGSVGAASILAAIAGSLLFGAAVTARSFRGGR